MDVVFAALPGLVLLVFHVVTFYVMIGYIRRMIECNKKMDALVTAVSAGVEKHEDSETGKVAYEDVYLVTFEYEYQDKRYHSHHKYSKHCRYIANTKAIIKINPHRPAESWTKDEWIDLFKVSAILPVFAFFDYLYYIIVLSQII